MGTWFMAGKIDRPVRVWKRDSGGGHSHVIYGWFTDFSFRCKSGHEPRELHFMTVLVTGGAGYIGSHMVWALLDAGEDVAVLDRLSTGFAWAVSPDARLVAGDIADTELVRSL